MLAFIGRRIVWALFLFLTATLVAYLIFFVLPADPASKAGHTRAGKLKPAPKRPSRVELQRAEERGRRQQQARSRHFLHVVIHLLPRQFQPVGDSRRRFGLT